MEVRINERVGKCPGRNYTHKEFMDASGAAAALEPGTYRDFTGYVCFGGNEGMAENASFDLFTSARTGHGFIFWHSGTWLGGVWEHGLFENGTWLSGRIGKDCRVINCDWRGGQCCFRFVEGEKWLDEGVWRNRMYFSKKEWDMVGGLLLARGLDREDGDDGK